MLNPKICLPLKQCSPSALLHAVSECSKKNSEDTYIFKCTAVILTFTTDPCISNTSLCISFSWYFHK